MNKYIGFHVNPQSSTGIYIFSYFPVLTVTPLGPHILETQDLSSLSPGVFRKWACSIAISQMLMLKYIMLLINGLINGP